MAPEPASPSFVFLDSGASSNVLESTNLTVGKQVVCNDKTSRFTRSFIKRRSNASLQCPSNLAHWLHSSHHQTNISMNLPYYCKRSPGVRFAKECYTTFFGFCQNWSLVKINNLIWKGSWFHSVQQSHALQHVSEFPIFGCYEHKSRGAEIMMFAASAVLQDCEKLYGFNQKWWPGNSFERKGRDGEQNLYTKHYCHHPKPQHWMKA